MSFSHWLKGATRVRFDDRTLSNVLKNAATGAGAVLGGPAGLAIAGAGNALGRGVAPGANFGNIVGAGVKGAVTAGGLHSAGGLLKGALNQSRDIATNLPGGTNSVRLGTERSLDALPSGPLPPVGLTPGTLSSTASTATSALPTSTLATASNLPNGGSFLGNAARGFGSFAKDHPEALAGGLKGLGSIATSGSENRMNEAEIRSLDQKTALTAEEARRRREQDTAMEPIRQALMLQLARGLGGPQQPIAANPYATPLPLAGA